MKRLAALCLACQAFAAPAAEPLGRLFFTPEQRAQLDTARKQRALRPVIEAAAEPAPPAAVVTYSGVVRRSDGRSTVWINSRPVHDRADQPADGMRARVHEDGAASITVPQQGSVRLQVGQTAELASGRIHEGYTRQRAHAAVEVAPAVSSAAPVPRVRRRFEHDRDSPPDSTP